MHIFPCDKRPLQYIQPLYVMQVIWQAVIPGAMCNFHEPPTQVATQTKQSGFKGMNVEYNRSSKVKIKEIGLIFSFKTTQFYQTFWVRFSFSYTFYKNLYFFKNQIFPQPYPVKKGLKYKHTCYHRHVANYSQSQYIISVKLTFEVQWVCIPVKRKQIQSNHGQQLPQIFRSQICPR